MSLVWTPGKPGCRRRRPGENLRFVVWHWTAGEGDPEQVVRVLQARALSIHRIIGYDGRVLETADPRTTVCYAAGSRGNGPGINVEISSKGIGAPLKNKPRGPATGEVRGKPLAALDFTDAQYAAIVRLADQLSDEFGIPRVTAPGSDVLSRPGLADFSGHLEHIHLSPRKIDCGTLVMQALRRHGYG